MKIEKRPVDGVNRIGAQRVVQIEPHDLGPEGRIECINFDCHANSP
jgi:hypothetical protein